MGGALMKDLDTSRCLVFWLFNDSRLTICAVISLFEICAYSVEYDKVDSLFSIETD